MHTKLATRLAHVVAFGTVTIAATAAPASAGNDVGGCTAQFRVPQARSAAGAAPVARRPVAMVPGLTYDPERMTPRAICRAGPGATRTRLPSV